LTFVGDAAQPVVPRLILPVQPHDDPVSARTTGSERHFIEYTIHELHAESAGRERGGVAMIEIAVPAPFQLDGPSIVAQLEFDGSVPFPHSQYEPLFRVPLVGMPYGVGARFVHGQYDFVRPVRREPFADQVGPDQSAHGRQQARLRRKVQPQIVRRRTPTDISPPVHGLTPGI
jgi:hypothetical protein